MQPDALAHELGGDEVPLDGLADGVHRLHLDVDGDGTAGAAGDAVVRIAEELEKESERIVIVGDAEAVRPSLEAEGFLVEVHA